MMKRLVAIISSILLTMLVVACSADNEEASAPSKAEHKIDITTLPDTNFSIDKLMQHIKVLSSDEFGGRAPMSEGEKKTLDYIENNFRQSGLKPLFGDSYLQPVALASIEAEPANLTLTRKGKDRIFKYGKEVMMWTRRTEEQVSVEDSDLVYVGYGIVAPEYNWDDYRGLDVTGKTVIILVNDPGFATQEPKFFNGNAMTYYGRWTYKYEEAARQGAAAALIVHDTKPAAYPWEVVEGSWSGPQFHLQQQNSQQQSSQRPSSGDQPVMVEGWMQLNVAKEIFQLSGLDFVQWYQRASSKPMSPIPLGSSVSVILNSTLEFNQSYNVGAMIEGNEAPDELFIYTAHWDHLGDAKQGVEGEDTIYNGAVDNATGIAALLELGREFSNIKPKRSVAFLAVTAEESGLLGSAAYTKDPAFKMNKTIGGVNMDALNVYGPVSDIVVVGYKSSQMEDVLTKVAALQNRIVVPETQPEKGYYYRSDHFNFAKKGVPILYAEGGTTHREKHKDYISQKQDEYTNLFYHKPGDEIRDDWDLRGAVEDVQLYYSIGQYLADSDFWPNWYKGNEFKGIRDKSLKEK